MIVPIYAKVSYNILHLPRILDDISRNSLLNLFTLILVVMYIHHLMVGQLVDQGTYRVLPPMLTAITTADNTETGMTQSFVDSSVSSFSVTHCNFFSF
jgi:hypothetical protein